MKNILGFILLSIPFLLVIVYMGIELGFKFLALVLGVFAFVMLCLWGGITLLTK